MCMCVGVLQAMCEIRQCTTMPEISGDVIHCLIPPGNVIQCLKSPGIVLQCLKFQQQFYTLCLKSFLTLIHEWGGLEGPGGSVFNCFGTYSVPTILNFCDFSFNLVTKNIQIPSSQNNK